MNVTIEQALSDVKLLGCYMPGDTWAAWRTLWRGVFALPPKEADVKLFKGYTGRSKWPKKPAREIWIIAGRRSGKSLNASLLATYTGSFQEYPQLASGEFATVPVISPTKLQSRVIKNYVSSFFHDNSYLRGLVTNETQWELSLKNRVNISIMTSDFRSIRGFSCPLVILEEACFFYQEGSRTDTEAVRAVRPSLATLNGMLCVISSPWSKTGAVWEAYQRYYGVEGDVLVWQSPSLVLNPSLDKGMIKKAIDEDREAGLTEWQAEFRQDLSSYVPPEVVDACTEFTCYERGPVEGIIYQAFTDMAGGSGQDSAALAIAHYDPTTEKTVLDCVRETKPPFSPEEVTKEFSATLKRYGISSLYGDKYAGDWPSEKFSQYGITYEAETRSKSQLYIELLPLLMSGEVSLLENETLKRQLCLLERRTHAGGRQSVDHPHGRNQHDDVSNAACGALVQKRAKGFFREVL